MTLGAGKEIGRVIGFWQRFPSKQWMPRRPIHPITGGLIGSESQYVGGVGGRDKRCEMLYFWQEFPPSGM